MMNLKISFCLVLLPFVSTGIFAQNDQLFRQALDEVQAMLEGTDSMSFERAVFVTENVYYDNRFSYQDFQSALNLETFMIQNLIVANDRSASMDFRATIDHNAQRVDVRKFRHTEEEKRELYRQALANWAIFTYMSDTTSFHGLIHTPYVYQAEDPFGMTNWKNSQVLNLLTNSNQKGNCFALTSLYKIFADRFSSDAYICTAPQHIYIQHPDHKGDFYNVELASGTHPGDGSLMTLTYTWMEGIRSGIALKRLDEKQCIALCLVNLAKSYEHTFGTKDAEFMLACAKLALQHDPQSLNAMLLKHQVLEERVVQFAADHKIRNVKKLRENKAIAETFEKLEAQVAELNKLGYHQMPLYMQEMILAALKREDNHPVMIKDRTPDPFPNVGDIDPEDKRYATLSGGIFEEVHTQEPQEQYGRFTLDVRTGILVKMDTENSMKFLIDPVVFAMSIDPLAAKYPSWSPYAAFENNPIRNIDPDGREVVPVDKKAGANLNAAIYSTFGEELGDLFTAAKNYKVDVDSREFQSAIRRLTDDAVAQMATDFARAAHSENKNFVKVYGNESANTKTRSFIVDVDVDGRFVFEDAPNDFNVGTLEWTVNGTNSVFIPEGHQVGTDPASLNLYSTDTPLPDPEKGARGRQRGMQAATTSMTDEEATELIQSVINADETLDDAKTMGVTRPIDAYDINESK